MTPEEAARWRKVAMMLATAMSHGAPVGEMLTADHDWWRLLAQAAGVPDPSRETVKLARELLERGMVDSAKVTRVNGR